MTRFSGKVLTTLAIIALPAPALAQAAKPCLTPVEAKSLIKVALPDVLNSVIDKCKTTLPASSFLTANGPQMVSKFRDASKSSFPAAKAAFLKLAGPQGAMLANLPDDAAMSLLSVGVNAALGQGLKPERCPTIDRAVTALAPLPLENLADVTTLLLEMGGGKTGKSPLQLCPAPGVAAKPATAARAPTKTEPAAK